MPANRRLARVFVFLAVSAHSSPLPGQETPPPSSIWREMDDLAKAAYVRGFADGAMAARAAVLQMTQFPQIRSNLFRDHPNVAAVFDSVVTRLVRQYTDLAPRGEPTVALMDRVYGDPANACVPFLGAVSYALKTLQGESADSTDRFLRRLRSLSAAECRP